MLINAFDARVDIRDISFLENDTIYFLFN